ncbi:hypothetical protein [Candidatus Binatus sp.]|uniref:hypothetical protein n=1 Tax=Candidatus Binatus sp. TaxID=2811406 RepID=UPI002F942F77
MSQIKTLLQKHQEERAQLERDFQTKRGKLDFLIETLEAALSEATPARRGRRKTGQSVADLAEKVLDSRPEGMFIPALLGELKRLGYETQSKNEPNTVNALLHREKDRFVRIEDRWILKKYQATVQTQEHKQISADESASIDAAELPAFLISILADGKGRSTEQLAKEAAARGWQFGKKSPNRVVHFGLINAAKRKLVERRNGIWYKLPRHLAAVERTAVARMEPALLSKAR